MKIKKRASQANVALNKSYYTLDKINEMLKAKVICHLDKNFNQNYETLNSWDFEEAYLMIFTEDLEELKVMLDEYGYYTTVAVGKNGVTYYINL